MAFYARGVARALTPQPVFSRRISRLFADIVPEQLDPAVRNRVNYYNRMQPRASLDGAVLLADIHKGGSRYYIDFMEYAKGFGPGVRINYLPGDTTHVPDAPCIVKSRPVAGDTTNSVLLNLDQFRHFRWARGDAGFLQKQDSAVWRGILNNEQRRALVRRYSDHRHFDIGYTGGVKEGYSPKSRLSITDQCRHRYIISVEGNDVATNLKWIMSSNSLCLSPRPRFETWFMEGALVPGKHYVELQPDFADLEDKVAHYNRHPDEALEIIANAHGHVRQFQDSQREEIISLLVLQKYFERNGQRPPEAFSKALFE